MRQLFSCCWLCRYSNYFVRVPTGLFGRRHSAGYAGVHQCPAPHVQLLQDDHVRWGHPQVAAASHPQTVGGVLPLLGRTLQIQYVLLAYTSRPKE